MVRISCASLSSIVIDDKYLLYLNRSSLKRNSYVYSPFGGAIEYMPKALEFLNSIDAEFERETPDLRLRVDISQIPAFDMWFTQKIDREFGVDRELFEEMVEEEKILSSLDSWDFQSEFIRLHKFTDVNDGITNYRFFEIFKIQFSKNKLEELKSKIDGDKLILATEEDITNRKIGDRRIAGSSLSILV